MGTSIVLDCARVCQNWSNGQNILKISVNTARIIANVSCYTFALMYLLIYRSYEALNADGLDKTSRQKPQFEKVIIPIL